MVMDVMCRVMWLVSLDHLSQGERETVAKLVDHFIVSLIEDLVLTDKTSYTAPMKEALQL